MRQQSASPCTFSEQEKGPCGPRLASRQAPRPTTLPKFERRSWEEKLSKRCLWRRARNSWRWPAPSFGIGKTPRTLSKMPFFLGISTCGVLWLRFITRHSGVRILEMQMTPKSGGLESMITVKASQRIFTYGEVTNLTGICAEHLENLAKRHRLGFIARATETQDNQTDE